jgi:hypothetical protein
MPQPSRIKALSVRQPWAWAILYGGKSLENRSEPILYRGSILTHAGRSRAESDQILPGMPAFS